MPLRKEPEGVLTTRAGLFAVLAWSQMGCALVVAGGRSTQRLRVDTDPPGAVAVSRGQRCETPCTLVLSRRRDAVVELSKEGYEPLAVAYRSRLGAALAGNLLLSAPGILVGIPIDVLSGAAYQLVPDGARVPLRPVPPGIPPAHDAGPRAEIVSAPASTTAPAGVVQLAPRPSPSLALSVNYGAGVSRIADDVGVVHVGVTATVRASGRILVGAAADLAAEMLLFGGTGATGSTFSALAGMDATPSSSSRLVLLLQAGVHRIRDTPVTVTLPALGARAEWAAVLRDSFTLGGYVAWWQDLGTRRVVSYREERVGGTTLTLGFAFGPLIP